MVERSFSTREVARITGFSVRQLDYWDRQALVNPSARPAGGRGTGRRYSQEDMAKLFFIRELKRRGWSTQRVHGALDYWAAIVEDPNPYKYIVIDHNDRSITLLCKTEQGVQTLVDALRPGGQLVLNIAVERITNDVKQLELVLET